MSKYFAFEYASHADAKEGFTIVEANSRGEAVRDFSWDYYILSIREATKEEYEAYCQEQE